MQIFTNKKFILLVTFQKNVLKMIQFVIKEKECMYTMERYMMESQIHVSLVSNCTGDE